MQGKTLLCGLIGLALGAPLWAAERVGSEPAWGPVTPALSAGFHDPGYPESAVANAQLAAVDTAAVDQLKQHNRAPGRAPLRIGVHRELGAAGAALDQASLLWLPAPDGGQTARIKLASPGAGALRLGFKLEGLPEGGALRFGSDVKRGGRAPALDAAKLASLARVDGRIWGPITEGDAQTVEFYLPPGSDPSWLRFEATTLSHMLVFPSVGFDRSKIGESEQPCIPDAKCEANPSQAFIDAKNAVASMVFEVDGGSSVCSGTLLNDTDTRTQEPYFFSAAHCFTTQAVANTLTTLWFYEATACGSGVQDASTQQVPGGAQVLYADTPSDVLLLKLNSAAPQGAHFLGWDTAPVNVNDDFLVIHHPAGDAKKYSRGRVTGLGRSELASGEFIQVAYSLAATEGGSSGSGLLTASSNGFLLRGGLLGGSSDCSNTNTDSPDNGDDYSRFDLAFPSMRQWLAPAAVEPPPVTGANYTGAWFNPNENGWGLVVLRGQAAETYAMYIYHYGQDSAPDWYLSIGNLSGNTYQTSLLAFTGPWFGLSPFNPAQVGGREAGTIQVQFTDTNNATIRFEVDGRAVESNLTRLVF